MLFRITERLVFPDPHLGEPDGLIGIGGDLSPRRLKLAYTHGIFPWYDFKDSAIQWWCPMDRFVIFPDEIHISHSMRPLLNSGRYTITFNRCFDRVLYHCATINNRIDHVGAWLGPNIIEAYTKLYEMGWCMSVEVWNGVPEREELIGGLYGVTTNNCFMGESMFSLAPSGSKLALIALAQYMQQHDGLMIDCQFETPHLKSMGGRHISYDEYMEILKKGRK